MKEEIGKRICEIRKSLNMNKQQFARLIGISSQYLGTVEAGVNGLALSTLISLCEKTHTSADYILFGTKYISDENFKKALSSIDEEQIAPAFEILQNLALFILRASATTDSRPF